MKTLTALVVALMLTITITMTSHAAEIFISPLKWYRVSHELNKELPRQLSDILIIEHISSLNNGLHIHYIILMDEDELSRSEWRDVGSEIAPLVDEMFDAVPGLLEVLKQAGAEIIITMVDQNDNPLFSILRDYDGGV